MSELTLPTNLHMRPEQNQPVQKIVPTAENLNIDLIRSWSGQEMLQYMKTPLRDQIVEIVRASQQVATTDQVLLEQQQAEEAQRQAAILDEDNAIDNGEAEAQRLAAEAEAQRVAAEAEKARLAAIEAAKPKKIVVDYQVKDEKGNPIGRPTHLEATSEEEMRQKLITAHEQATRAFHRLKGQKVTFERKAQEPAPQIGLSDAEMLALARDLKSDDPRVALEAQRKIVQSDIDKALQVERAKNAELQGYIDAANASNQFLADHRNDFLNNKANVEMLKQYLADNEMPWTRDNLEVAFHALESQLAPVEQPVTPAVAANPQPAVAPAAPAPQQPVVSSTPAVAPASASPATAAPAPAVSAANPAPQRRPGVNAGIVPGESSAARPSAAQNNNAIGLTITEILSWDGPTMRKNMGNPTMRPKIEAVMKAENTPEKIAARNARKQEQMRLANSR